jgi:hypothetical protein
MPLVVSVKRCRVARVRKKRKTLIPIRREKVARVVTRPDHQVGAVGDDLVEQADDLLRWVLAVGVEVGAGVVAVAERVEVAGLQRRPQALVEGQRGDHRARLARPLGGGVAGAVVDDEHVGLGQRLPHPGDHRGDRGLLVPGGDEDERPHGSILPCGHGNPRSAATRGGLC